MRKLFLSLTIAALFCLTVNGQNKQELLIVGSMHTVPKSVKNSYAPMLKEALKYRPQLILVENPGQDDIASWEYLKNGWSKAYKEFYFISDSLKQAFAFDKVHHQMLISKSFEELTDSDLEVIISGFGYKCDFANHSLYKYLQEYGAQGSAKPLRNENEDLTYKLALKLGISQIYGVDSQEDFEAYNTAIYKYLKFEQSENNSNKIKKLNKKDYSDAIIPAIFGSFGRHTNSRKSLERLHSINSMQYVTDPGEFATEVKKYWDLRNEKIAKNVIEQVTKHGKSRSILIIGAGHLIGVREAINKLAPDINVMLIYEK